ncbi:MAG: sigma factor-like helix-turn-helix DNA-binding protein [Roseiarcus sp.]
MSSSREWCDDAGAMRRFGLALVRDDRFVCDDASAAALVEKLFRQASLTLIDDPASDLRSARVKAFAQFIRLYRRHVRRLAADEADGGWIEASASHGRANASVTSGVRNLPLELREALLLVVLVGFSHREAAGALDIPLAAVVERLGRARARICTHIDAAHESAPKGAAWPSAAHLRIVK